MRPKAMRIGDTDCLLQRFGSLRELLSLLRTPCIGGPGVDWFNGDRPWNEGFFGFSDAEQLEKLLLHGSLYNEEQRKAKARETPSVKRSKRDRCVAGAVPIVPAAIAGDPACMVALRRAPVTRRTVSLCVEIGAPHSIPAEDLRDAGRAVAATVRGLDRAGWGVELRMSYITRTEKSRYGVYGFSVPLKCYSEPMDPNRCVLLAEPAMSRGAGFCWSAHMPGFEDANMGYGVENVALEDGIHRVLAGKSVNLDLSDIVTVVKMYGSEPAQNWLLGILAGPAAFR